MPKFRFSGVVRCLSIMLFCVSTIEAYAQQTIHVPADQSTIQAAIDAASDGDTILVASGTYYEHLDFSSKAITLISASGANTTILDGSLTGTVVFLGTPTGKAPAVLNGFTVQNGEAEATHPPYPGVDYGGGVVILGSADLLNSTVENNNSCNVEIVAGGDVTVHGNHVLRSIFSGESGGGCHTNPFGISVHDGPNDNLHPIHIDGNLVEINQDDGIELDSVFEPVFITHNLIRNNNGAFLLGTMGIRLSGAANSVIADNVVTGNSGAGLLSQTTASMTVVNNTFYANGTANSDDGEASEVDVASVGTINLVNNIIVGTATDGPPLGCSNPADASQLPLTWDHNLIYNTTTKTGSIPCTGSPGNDNLFVDPQFANALTGNLHLSTGSPAIDAGNNSAPYMDSTDFDGNPRIQDATGKGYGTVDMGAYEFPGIVQAPPTQLVLITTQNVIQPGQSAPLVVTATSSLGTPTGSVTLFVDGAQFITGTLNATGSINFTTAALKPGYHALYATYPGQGVYSPATSLLIYISVANYTPTLTLISSQNPSALGEPITFTATIASPDGAVLSPIAIADGRNTPIQLTPDANGVATYTTSSLTLGTHNINATYSGDATHNPAYASTVVQQVISAYVTTTTLLSSLNPSTLGQPVSFTARVSSTNGAPTGSMQFAADGVLLVTLPLDTTQSAMFTASTLTAGTHSITATYIPTGLFASSSMTMTQHVSYLGTTTVLTATPTTAVLGSSVTLRAVASPNPASMYTPGGKMTFYNESVPLGSSSIAGGAAVLSITSLPLGTNSISATYGGDSKFAVSNSNVVPVVIVAPTTIAVTSSINPGGFGHVVTFTAGVSSSAGGVPTGAVTFFDGQTAIGSASLAAGAATISTSVLGIGVHSITAQLTPGSGFATSTSAPFAETIEPFDFALSTGTPVVTIKAGQHTSITLDLASLGGFNGSVALSCSSTLPPYVKCEFPDATVLLNSNRTNSASLTIGTSEFFSATQSPLTERVVLAFLFPIPLFGFVRRRTQRMTLRNALLLGCVALFVQTLTGCGAEQYRSSSLTPDGSYTILVTGTANSPLVHTLPLTLIVTQ